ncbi:MAG TPA: hypothetical protein VGH98_19020 [Gemmatimonadaceae bacterium]|jgi:hypothetical protein
MKYNDLVAVAALMVLGSTIANAQGRGKDRGKDRDDEHHNPPAQRQVSPQEQQRRIAEEQKRQTDYQRSLDAQVRAAQARTAQIQAQQRTRAQLEAHERYVQELQQQQEQLRRQRDYAHDPYVTAAPAYRYRFNGVARETNQYGADALRAAVNNGYRVGYQQGQADRSDGVSSNYRRSFAYQDANYGYNGSYIAQSDYNYYFRQGFSRGYSDGYGSRLRYGALSNGSASILSNILSGILGLTTIH